MFSQKMELLLSRFSKNERNSNIYHTYIRFKYFYADKICFSRLKLIPDERRSQQSSTLYGAGTIMVDQEFLFHVKTFLETFQNFF